MNKYPSLLNSKAQILSSLNRVDLLMLAIGYLTLSKLKVSGLFTLISLVLLLIIKKAIDQKINRGFFKFLVSRRSIDWRMK